MNKIATVGIIGVLGVALAFYALNRETEELAFPDLTGPLVSTVLPLDPPPRTTPEVYFTESNSGIAVLLQDSDASWLGIAHGLKSIGVPFRIVESIDLALEHDVILVYPSITGANTAPETLSALANHVQSGNTLIAFSVIGGGMPALFGFETTQERQDLLELNFDSGIFNGEFFYDPAESSIRLSALDNPSPLPGLSYHTLKHPALATYDDGSAAITENFYTAGERTGHAYAIGFDFGHFILRAQNERFTGLVDTYVNDYQPKIDTLLRLLARIYNDGSRSAVQLLPTPFNREFTALITHDIDYTRSLQNVSAYAELETSHGIPATYFLQTKYITDYNDSLFFTQESQGILQSLNDLGMEIASHSVAHSNEFRNMDIGTGTETYPSYKPFVFDFETVRNASISGELRVSKYLLDNLTTQSTVSFRPGHLSMPYSLPEMLLATGYKYSSTMTANSALTHLPFRTNFSRSYDTELDIFEIPITIEDEFGRLGDRIDESIELANKIGKHGGVVNVLIHTDVLDHKLEFERRFIAEFKERAWFGTVAQFGDWWAVRDSAIIQLETVNADTRRLLITTDGEIDGLSIRLPKGWAYQEGLAGSQQQGDVLVLGPFENNAQVLFSVPHTQ
ncbi:MAG: polysaccharide deacetylase family protein [Gammaproteobacteria bacterium]